MKVIYIKPGEQLHIDKTCVALGFFDGMHIGHLELLKEVEVVAKKTGYKKALMTFDRHPKSYLMEREFQYLMSLEDKIEYLQAYGFEYMFVICFTQQIASLSPQEFVDDYLIQQNIKHVVCGFDYHFGCFGKGDVALLRQLGEGRFQVSEISKKQMDHLKVSSSYIREVLMMGNVEKVNLLLKREYKITGQVIYGRQIGKTQLGFATANVDYQRYVLPRRGVYGAKVLVAGKIYYGMANIGYNPTFGDLTKPSLEVHIFDFDENIYGQVISVYFTYHVRDERKFASKEDLILQLQKDQEDIKIYFKKNR